MEYIGQFESRMDPELGKNAAAVRIDGAVADIQFASDFLARNTGDDHSGYLLLALGEGREQLLKRLALLIRVWTHNLIQ